MDNTSLENVEEEEKNNYTSNARTWSPKLSYFILAHAQTIALNYFTNRNRDTNIHKLIKSHCYSLSYIIYIYIYITTNDVVPYLGTSNVSLLFAHDTWANICSKWKFTDDESGNWHRGHSWCILCKCKEKDRKVGQDFFQVKLLFHSFQILALPSLL